MKKYLITLLLCLGALAANAQIFTSIKYLDKFDDVIKSEQRKTLIIKTDSTITIEEKGKAPVIYYIIGDEDKTGSKDDVVNLVDDVYGYESKWAVVREDLLQEFKDALYKAAFDDTPENKDSWYKLVFVAYHRTITTQYTGRYETEYFWIEDAAYGKRLGGDIHRIVYIMK